MSPASGPTVCGDDDDARFEAELKNLMSDEAGMVGELGPATTATAAATSVRAPSCVLAAADNGLLEP